MKFVWVLILSATAYAADDSFFVSASPAEVRQAMNQLGADGLMQVPGPRCLKSVLVQGGVDSRGRVRYTAGGGLLGQATGQLREVDGGTEVQITANVVSPGLHRLVMGTPQDIAAKIDRQVRENRRR